MLVGYVVAMRLHISLTDALVAELDRQVGPRERSSFIEAALRHALEDRARDDALEAAFGTIDDTGHDWDGDPADWVRRQRALNRRAG